MEQPQPDLTDPLLNDPVLKDPRRHDMDALRAFAMLLGIILHAALSMTGGPWIVQDRASSPLLGLTVSAIHGFRMPLFFLLSGFFVAMLWRKRGAIGLLKHRGKRIGLPLALGCVTIVPLMWFVMGAARPGVTDFEAGVPEGVDTSKEIWTASAYADLAAIRTHVEAGADLDAPDPQFGITPLGWGVISGRAEAITLLAEAGADPNGRYRDQNTPMHTAAFLGRAEAGKALLAAGADVTLRSQAGETPMDSLRHGKGTVDFIAGLLRMKVDFAEVEAGREVLRPLIAEREAEIKARGVDGKPAPEPTNWIASVLQGIFRALTELPFFHHLWFLWFLCWLILGFTIVAAVLKPIGGALARVPAVLIASPLCFLWLIPLTLPTQFAMQSGGTLPGFGPDTSAGLVPIPHVLGYYAVFFGFGAMLYLRIGPAARLGQLWWLQLIAAVAVLPIGLAVSLGTPWGLELFPDDSTRRTVAVVSQATFAWLMCFGLIGLFETVLARARPGVRYLSDASYWLYLVHLPLVVYGQHLLRDLEWPVSVKLPVLTVSVIAILIASYQLVVRRTWIGRLLNGPRPGGSPAPAAAPAPTGA